jgi:hypothetical protein
VESDSTDQGFTTHGAAELPFMDVLAGGTDGQALGGRRRVRRSRGTCNGRPTTVTTAGSRRCTRGTLEPTKGDSDALSQIEGRRSGHVAWIMS